MRRRPPGFLASVLFLVSAFAPIAARAQLVPLGGAIQVNSSTAGDQLLPALARDGAGNFVVVWSSDGQDGDGFGVFAQLFAADGSPVGGEIQVSTVTAGAQGGPEWGSDVAMDADGDFVVVWGSEGDEIRARRFDGAGGPLGGEFLVSPVGGGYPKIRLDPEAAMAEDGRFVVTWTGGRTDSKPFLAIFAQRFDPNGTPVGDPLVLGRGLCKLNFKSDVAIDDDGDFVLTWLSPETSGGAGGCASSAETSVFARQVASDGTPGRRTFELDGIRQPAGVDGLSWGGPAVSMDGDGDFLVGWDAATQSGSRLGWYGQRIASDGTVLGKKIQLNTTAAAGRLLGDVALRDDGSFVAAWSEDQGSGVTVQLFQGSPVVGPVGVETVVTAAASVFDAALRIDGVGRLRVAWTDDSGLDGDGRGVFLRTYGGAADPAQVGHWPLDEGSGTTAANSAGNGLDGTLEGAAGWTVGQRGTGGLFDGSDDLIRVLDSGADSPIDVTDALTIALWVRPDGIDGSNQVLVSKDGTYEFEIGKYGADAWDLRLENVLARTAATPVEEGVWQHLAVTWDGEVVCTYYNGLLDGCSGYVATLVADDHDLGLGARPSPLFEGGPVFHFEGALDEVYVYNRVFSEAEIAALVLAELDDLFPPMRGNFGPAGNLPPGTTVATITLDTDEDADCRYDPAAGVGFDAMAGVFTTTGGTGHAADVAVADGIGIFHVRCRDVLGNTNGDDAVIAVGVGSSDLCSGVVGDWRLEEGSGCAVGDETGANGGTVGPDCPGANAPTWVAGRGGTGSALAFDGIDDEVSVASPAGLSGIGEITLAAWIRHGPTGIYRSIVDRRDAAADGFDLYLDPTSKLFLRVDDQTLPGTATVADGQWHHVAGVYDGSELRLYVDGVLDAAAPGSAGTLDVTAPLYLGRNWESAPNLFAGTLDEVTVHGRALTEVEVLDLATTGVPACVP